MKIKHVLPILVLGLIGLSSCKKEGCTDDYATNYSADAKKDDGSCKYEGKVVIWYGQTTSSALQNDGAVTLTYYVDGEIVGSSATSVFWTAAPECGQTGTITITKDLGSEMSKTATYEVKDQTGFTYWTGTLNFLANTCEGRELVW